MVIPLATAHRSAITPYENTTPSELLGGCLVKDVLRVQYLSAGMYYSFLAL